RYLCLTGHYRTQLNFTWDALDAAATGLARMRSAFHALPVDAHVEAAVDLLERFTAEVSDDLNAPRALAIAWETLRGHLPAPVKRATLAQFDDVFGLGLAEWAPAREDVPAEVQRLAKARAEARKAKNFAEADRLRDALREAGYDVEDKPDGYALKRR
ncbi:MAG TPA: cysteine--tRNA ligase, partial [Casimicrobiaceae bacterium]|nr:cysteine--tRNA ligase [Casimicrobiaceae bacterium]